jgi:small-conductance mechanosensitive channel
MRDTLREWLLDPTVGKLVVVLLGLLILVAAVRLGQRSLGHYVKDPDVRYRARKGMTLLGYVAAFLFLTVVFRNQLGGLTVAFGVAGAGIAFALQEVITSAAGWAAIATGGFYSTGDRVQLGGIRGDVIDIGLLRTTLMECGQWVEADQYTGRIVRVANSFVFKEPVFNYSADFPFVWDELKVPVKYGTDHRLARKLLLGLAQEIVGEYSNEAATAWRDVARRYLIEEASVQPAVTLTVNDNWIELTLRYIVDYRRRRLTKDLLFTRLLDEIDATGGRVGIASTTFQLVDPPVLDVRVLADRGTAGLSTQ